MHKLTPQGKSCQGPRGRHYQLRSKSGRVSSGAAPAACDYHADYPGVGSDLNDFVAGVQRFQKTARSFHDEPLENGLIAVIQAHYNIAALPGLDLRVDVNGVSVLVARLHGIAINRQRKSRSATALGTEHPRAAIAGLVRIDRLVEGSRLDQGYEWHGAKVLHEFGVGWTLNSAGRCPTPE